MLVSKPAAASLVQQKKQQWAREREEMSHLYLPWGSGERYNNRLQVRNQFASNLELNKPTFEYIEPTPRQRSPSLPPIHNIEADKQKENFRNKEILNRNVSSTKRFAFYDEDGEGDTSGYGSETVNHMNNRKNSNMNENLDGRLNPVLAWQQNENRNGAPSSEVRTTTNTNTFPWSSRSPRSANGDEGRPRWGDRGVATGRLWEPTTPNARLPQVPNQNKSTPAWVERGLNMIENTAEVLLIDQRSSTNSNQDCDRSSCNGSDEGRTYLRGQNVPIEPEIRAQRENKRIKAMELQSAILGQLEDREKRRQEEREQRLREERLEELRIQRQQEEDKIRLEEERRRNEEKMKLEQRKLDALKKALEDAERKSREDKEKRFLSHKQFHNTQQCNGQNENTNVDENANIPKDILPQGIPSPTKTNATYDLRSARSPKKDDVSQQHTGFNTPRETTAPNSLNLFIHSVPPLSLGENQFNIVPIGLNGEVIQGPGSNMQFAVLVPQNLNSLYSVSLNALNNVNESTDEKILTPSKYRNLRSKDVSTQTDLTHSKDTRNVELERDVDKTYGNIDENAPQDSNFNSLKKDRRFRSEERYKKDLDSRPKWGVNRPVAQYKKQSEKDPFYTQKRKMRQKFRPQPRQYLSQSSEDSRSPSPPLSTDKNFIISNKHRNSISQSYWRNKRSSQDMTKIHVPEMSSLAVEYNQIGNINEPNSKSPNTSPNKRVTLSQKFFNDKYGNRKLWVDDINERNPKLNILEGENRKKIVDQLNIAKRDYLAKHSDGYGSMDK